MCNSMVFTLCPTDSAPHDLVDEDNSYSQAVNITVAPLELFTGR